MATPFGVYLTDGTVQAGVGNLALMSSGVMMMGILLLAVGALNAAFWALSRAVGHPVPLLIPLGDDIVIRNGWLGLASVGESLLLFLVFMLLMRLTRLAGYHAAEHQTVHAIERCEPLVPAIVARMPRAHPRCGTNLLAAVLLFTQARQAMGYVPALDGMAEPLAALAALFLWRPVGTFLQERFTTKPADAREIQSGIAAGSTLLARYLEEAPTRPTLFRRVWCSGMIQILTGFVASLALISAVQFLAEPVRHLLMRH
jgi:hypothetical protein